MGWALPTTERRRAQAPGRVKRPRVDAPRERRARNQHTTREPALVRMDDRPGRWVPAARTKAWRPILERDKLNRAGAARCGKRPAPGLHSGAGRL
jgi:hypothetical protein